MHWTEDFHVRLKEKCLCVVGNATKFTYIAYFRLENFITLQNFLKDFEYYKIFDAKRFLLRENFQSRVPLHLSNGCLSLCLFVYLFFPNSSLTHKSIELNNAARFFLNMV